MKLLGIVFSLFHILGSTTVLADEQGDREREILRENPSSETYNDDQTRLEEREREREEKNTAKDN